MSANLPAEICACQSATKNVEFVCELDGTNSACAFSELREQCSALHRILIPDEIWPAFRQWHVLPDDVAAHSSVVLLAFRRGLIPRVTGPIHRYLLSSNGIREAVSNQYINDLRENWMFDSDPLARHRLSRIFRGRLIELQFAEWLENQKHVVTGLEAIGNGPDIQTVSAIGVAHSFEVKFFGLQDSNFEMILRSMGGHPAGGAISVYRPINYLLFRVYEAAR